MFLVCKTCQFDLWLPVAELEVSTLGFYNDDRFPGRCILMLHDHYEHLDELPADVAEKFMRDQVKAGAAIRMATGCARINYCILGNTEPHVHAHIIPRYADDPVITRPIWEHPQKAAKLAAHEADRMIGKIRTALKL